MRRMAWFVAIGLSVVWNAAPAAARDWFVNNVDGNDKSLGLQAAMAADGSGPFRTIGRALQSAQASDRIVLAKTAKPYRETLSLVGGRLSGSGNRFFVIEGNGAILDGSSPLPADGWQHYQGNVFRFTPRALGYEGLFLNDRPVPQAPVAPGATAPPELKTHEWCLWDGSLYFCVQQDKLPRDYRLTYAEKQTGITLYHVEQVAIMNLTVQGFRVDGIHAANSARNIRLVGLTVRGNGRAGITVGGASLVDIEGCLVGDNSRAQLLTLPLSETHVRSSDLLSLTAPAWVDRGGRFFLDDQAIQGGRDKILANPAKEPKQEKQDKK